MRLTPSVVDEFPGKPVEQLSIRWLLALHAKVIRSANQSLPKVMLPEAIHDHTGQQRSAPCSASTIHSASVVRRNVVSASGRINGFRYLSEHARG